MWTILNISSLPDILVLPWNCWKDLRTTPWAKVFNFQEPTQKSHFGTSSAETLFHFLKRPAGNQYPEVLRILVPHKILVLQKLLYNLRCTTYVQLNNFPDPIHQKDFDIYDPVTIYNFPKKLAQKKSICVRS